MEQNNLDKEIKKLLDSREIQPSLESWDRLDAMLSTTEAKKNNKSFYYWLRIASVIVVSIGTALWFVNSDSEKDNIKNGTIVTEVTNTVESSSESIKKVELVQNEDSLKLNNKSDYSIAQKNKKSHEKNKLYSTPNQTSESQNIVESELKEEVVVTQPQSQVALVEVSVNPEAKTEPVVKQKLRVDPNMLLEQVENEQKITFRQKVFKTIKKGYQEAKVAISTRNQESSNNNQ